MFSQYRSSFRSSRLSSLAVLFLAWTLNGAGWAGAAEPTTPPAAPATPAAPKADPAKMMYALGVLMAQQLDFYKLSESEFADVVRGLKDGYSKAEATAGIDMQTYGTELRKMAQERSTASAKAEAQAERTASASFLQQMAAEPGVIKTASGLLYTEILAGTGASPLPTDRIKVHYKGTLRDGTVFDSSYDRGQPMTFGLNQVIPCWTEAIQRMKVGGKSKLVCPADIAYGDRQAGKIKPGSTLVFEVELLEIVAPPAPKDEAAPAKPEDS